MKKFFPSSFIKDESGQSLMEIIVGLAIGAILIGTASFGIAFMLRSTTTNQNLSGGSQLTQGLLSNVQTLANSNWQNIYGLAKGSGSQYFLSASGTSYIVVSGQEGVVDNDVTDGLVGEWKFDEATTTVSTITYDATGNNNNGTITASSMRTASPCKIANCLYFDTTTQVTLGSGTGYDTSSFSFSSWMRPIQLSSLHFSGDPNENIFLGRENYTVSGFRAGVSGAAGSVGAIRFWTTQSGGTLTLLSSGNNYVSTTTGAFYHVVVTYNSPTSQGNMYLNGVLVSSSTGSYIPPVGRTLGIDGAIGGVYYLNSYMDDFRWYNRALSAAEVKQLYSTQPFTRYFYVDNVCRTNDSSASISSSTSCSGGTVDDPLTQKITAVTNWLVGASSDQVSLTRYVTRWGNFAIRQTDWSGNSGQEGPLTAPNASYASSSNIIGTSTYGSFQLQNLSQQ